MFIRNNGLIAFNRNGTFVPLPLKYIVAEGYECHPRRIQDISAERNVDGALLRDTAKGRPSTISVQLNLESNEEVNIVFSLLKQCYTVPAERKLNVRFYSPEDDAYLIENMYLADPQFKMTDITGDKVYYEPMTLDFIGYGDNQ